MENTSDPFFLTLAIVAALAAAPMAKAPEISAKTLSKSAAAFVAGFESKLAFAVADEDYTQVVLDAQNEPTAQRLTHGEMFLTFMPADRDWIAVHDFEELDGRPLPTHETLEDILRRGPLEKIKGDLMQHNAQFNIGTIPRTVNEPTLCLLMLEPGRLDSIKFSLKPTTTSAMAAGLSTILFTERGEHPLVRNQDGKPIFATGEITLEPATGNIHRTLITLADKHVTATLTTIYGHDDNLDLWVPTIFLERYERTSGGPHETIQCQSRYTNYRRFDSVGRIKK